MYRIGIMEDCLEGCEKLEKWFQDYGEKMQLVLDIRRWKQEEDLMKDIAEGRTPDILFLSIGNEIPDRPMEDGKKKSWWMKVDGRTREAQLSSFGKKENVLRDIRWSGIALGRKLREKAECKALQLIYISPRERFYKGMIQTRPIDFLVEPLTKEKALSALRNALAIVKNQNERFSFQFGKESYFLPMRDILYIYINGRRVSVKAVNGLFEFNGKMKEVVKQMPEEFLAIHRSYIINKNHVLRYDYETLQMMDGTIFGISKPNRKMARQILMDR